MFNEMLEAMPRDLLFVLRTTNLVRSINKDLGAKVNRFQIFARAAVEGAHVDDAKDKSTKSMLARTRFELQLFFFALYRWFSGLFKKEAEGGIPASI